MDDRDRFSLIDVVVCTSIGELPHAKAHLRVRRDEVPPWDVMLRCVRTGGRWWPSQPWRGGLPHPDPEAYRYVLTLRSGSADLRVGDELVPMDERRALVVADIDRDAG